MVGTSNHVEKDICKLFAKLDGFDGLSHKQQSYMCLQICVCKHD
jgi:hypothetical protein